MGVDVFFVISGYLITRLIVGELEDERFRFARFYLRRARRLLPALFVTMAATLAVSAWRLSPPRLEDCARALLCALVSGSNIFFPRCSRAAAPSWSSSRDAPGWPVSSSPTARLSAWV